MENKEEQPIKPECNFIENNSNALTDTNGEGSSLGKFKSADELFKAYTNLEKEFTKKCQKIKELEARNDNELVSSAKATNEISLPNSVGRESSEKHSSNKSIKEMMLNTVVLNTNDTTDCSNKNLVKDACLGNANSQEDKNQNSFNNEVMTNEEFKNMIYSNVEIRNKFIENYLNEIQSQKTAPLMVNSLSSNFCVMPKQKPQTLNDAAEAAKEMFKN